MGWGYFPDAPSSDAWPEAEKKSYEGAIMTAMSTVAANPEASGYGAIIQTPALHPGMFSGLMPWLSGRDIKNWMRKFSRTAHIFALARDKGSGVITSPTHIRYKMHDTDEANLSNGIEKVLRILAAAGAEEIGTHHKNGRVLKVRLAEKEEFERFVKEESLRPLKNLSSQICSAHQMGSCRMGVDPATSAVRPTGETWEVEGLYVADSSVFPTALGVNPMVTIQAIAYCTAQSVLEALDKTKHGNIESQLGTKIGKFEKDDLRLDGKLCYLPQSAAFELGIAAIIALCIAQVIGILFVCRKLGPAEQDSGLKLRKPTASYSLLIFSWISFGIAVILMSGATSMSRGQPFGRGWLDGECYLVKDGVYVGSAVLGLLALGSTLGSAAITMTPRKAEENRRVHAQVEN
ncbi:UNVERIFIED_CONTAM: Long-chain-alcohol oxidase FAO4A [Sesamum radiatum]|uniref:Long-chain-alcohol oxidase FAO4A n=1 Tax=Sesamum radiatum TaxID=300843 RepID=A0AAW2L115_SESRA